MSDRTSDICASDPGRGMSQQAFPLSYKDFVLSASVLLLIVQKKKKRQQQITSPVNSENGLIQRQRSLISNMNQ